MTTLKELASHFRPPAFPGSYFLSLEGIEGAGKSTQILNVQKHLENKGFRVLILREPGGTIFGEKLRSAILASNQELHPVAELHLFASSRAQLLQEVTLKELSIPGTIIIYDRYIDSTLAYQGQARGLGLAAVLTTHLSFPLTLAPHLTLYLRIDPEVSYQRQKMRNAPKDYFEKRGEDFYQKLVDGYDQAAELFPDRIVTLAAHEDQDSVFEAIKTQLDKLISSR
jgi:dTMP kinase